MAVADDVAAPSVLSGMHSADATQMRHRTAGLPPIVELKNANGTQVLENNVTFERVAVGSGWNLSFTDDGWGYLHGTGAHYSSFMLFCYVTTTMHEFGSITYHLGKGKVPIPSVRSMCRTG